MTYRVVILASAEADIKVISGANRVIYEVRDETLYIHVICDSRMDLTALLHWRLLRSG